MIVTRPEFDKILETLVKCDKLAIDTEATSLRAYHSGRLFSIIIASEIDGEVKGFYFNFKPYAGLAAENVLLNSHLVGLSRLFSDRDKTWFLHNAAFDLPMLAKEGLHISGTIHCTMSIARVEYNEHLSYSLDSCLERIELEKSDAVENYIKEKALWEWEEIPGKKTRKKNKHFDQVPFDIIVPYGLKDATGTFLLGRDQEASIQKQDAARASSLPALSAVVENERKLTRTLFVLAHQGVRIDRPYCVRAASHESNRAQVAVQKFKHETGRDFVDSSKTLQPIFLSDKERWGLTDKGNPSFESSALETFENPAAKIVLEHRDAKSRSDFYNGFLYHADEMDILHPNLVSGGTIHGRLSSRDPNMQNLTSEDDDLSEFLIRRAFIPDPDSCLVSIDYKSMEYIVALDLACGYQGRLSPLASKVLSGLDFHEATIQSVKDLTGIDLPRKTAKIVNFLTLYGGGAKALAANLKCPLSQAASIRSAVRDASPEISELLYDVQKTAEVRGYIFNWLGRKCHFKDSRFAYKAPNYLISGGCADIVKVAMNKIAEYFSKNSCKSRMVLSVHDELVFNIPKDELTIVSELKHIMENVYPYKFLPLGTSVSHSFKSLGDLEDGNPA